MLCGTPGTLWIVGGRDRLLLSIVVSAMCGLSLQIMIKPVTRIEVQPISPILTSGSFNAFPSADSL